MERKQKRIVREVAIAKLETQQLSGDNIGKGRRTDATDRIQEEELKRKSWAARALKFIHQAGWTREVTTFEDAERTTEVGAKALEGPPAQDTKATGPSGGKVLPMDPVVWARKMAPLGRKSSRTS